MVADQFRISRGALFAVLLSPGIVVTAIGIRAAARALRIGDRSVAIDGERTACGRHFLQLDARGLRDARDEDASSRGRPG